MFPNKFSALGRDLSPTRTIHRSRRSIDGFGVHDVIVETPDHSQAMALMSDVHVADILRVYKIRYDELSLDPRISHITIFKNHGADAGTSLEHPHSQLIAAPVISYQVRQRFQEALRHFELLDLGRVLGTILAKLYHGLQDPDFNFTVRSAPAECVGVKYFHWYLSIIPRLTRVGFELGSGMFINTVLPEAAAKFLRKVQGETTVGVRTTG